MLKITQGGYATFCMACTLLLITISHLPPVLAKRRVKLKGAGASFPGGVYNTWIPSYKAQREKYVDLDMDYKSVGSSSGKARILDPDTDVDYAGSDSLLSAKQLEERPDLVMFPTMAGAVVIGYNLPTVKACLVFTMDQLAGIYNGSIRAWNDSTFRDLNPNVTFPDLPVITVARSDGSGTTETFTSALSSSMPSWRDTYGAFSAAFDKDTGEPVNWRPGVITYYGKKTRGMSGVVMSFDGAIGYLSAADAAEITIPIAKIANSFGQIVEANTTTVQASMDRAALAMGGDRLTVSLTEHQTPDSYPICTYTYFIVSMTKMTNCDSAQELVRYVDWFINENTPRKACEALNMVPLSNKMRQRVQDMVLKKMTCNGIQVWKEYENQKKKEEFDQIKEWLIPLLTTTSLLIIVISAVVGYFARRKIKFYKMLARNEWHVPIEDIIFYSTSKSKVSGKSRFTLWPSVTSLTDIDDIDDGYQMVQNILQWPGKFGGNTVGLRLFEIKGLKRLTRPTKKLLLWMKDYTYHHNVLKFYGLTEIECDYYVVSEYCSKGILSEVLKDSKFTLNKDFKFSLSLDIANGLAYLHSKDIIHGHLSSSTCLIDFKWTVKIADWEYWKIFTHMYPKKNPLILLRKDADDVGKNEAAFRDFWTSPEIIKSDFAIFPSATSDIYSYSIIVQEIFTRQDPYFEHCDSLSHDEILKAIVNNHLRPTHGEDTPLNMRHVMELCWAEEVTRRPTTEQLLKMLRGVHSFKKSVLDTMMEQVDEYALTLEEKLHEKDAELQEIAFKLRSLMEKQIPPHFHRKLGGLEQRSEVEQQESVSVITVKLCLPTSLTSSSNSNPKTGKRILGTFSQLENHLTQLVQKYNAFRVDSSSGVYTIVCGLGRKDKHHVTRAASLGLDILDCSDVMRDAIRELYEEDSAFNTDGLEQISFRIAIHKGRIHAGVVNNGLPKCFLIGNAMETVHQLLHHSIQGKILVTKQFHDAIMPLSEGLCILEVNAHGVDSEHLQEEDQRKSTYWLKRWPTPTPPVSPSSSIRLTSCNESEAEKVTSSVSCQTDFSVVDNNTALTADKDVSDSSKLSVKGNIKPIETNVNETVLVASDLRDAFMASVSQDHVVLEVDPESDMTYSNTRTTKL